MPNIKLDRNPGKRELQAGVMYRLTLANEPDSIFWQDLSMESHPDRVASCEICIDAKGYPVGHKIAWPSSWIWLDGQSVPNLFVGGLRYFAVRRDKRLTFIAEHTYCIAA